MRNSKGRSDQNRNNRRRLTFEILPDGRLVLPVDPDPFYADLAEALGDDKSAKEIRTQVALSKVIIGKNMCG